MKRRQTTWLLLLCLIAASLMSAVAWARFTALRERAIATAEDLAACERLAQRLVALQTASGQRALGDAAPEVAQAIDAARTAAGLADPAALRVDPGQVEREERSDALRLAVPVHLERVQLRQLVAFVHHLSQNGGGAQVRSLVLLPAPPATEGAEAPPTAQWNAQVTLTYAVRDTRPIKG